MYHTPAAAEATGVRGLPPASFVMSPDDVIVARVRDIDDKVWCVAVGGRAGRIRGRLGCALTCICFVKTFRCFHGHRVSCSGLLVLLLLGQIFAGEEETKRD